MTSWGNLQPLSTEFYSPLRYGLFLVLFLHLPFVGFIIGGSAVSLLLSFLGKEKRDPAYLRFSKELMETVMIRRWPLFLFGIVPLLLVWFAYARILFDPTPLSWHIWSAILVILFAGFSLLHRYRSHGHRATDLRPLPVGIGAAGLLTVILAFFLFSNVYGILFNPEKLPLLRKQIGFLLSWDAGGVPGVRARSRRDPHVFRDPGPAGVRAVRPGHPSRDRPLRSGVRDFGRRPSVIAGGLPDPCPCPREGGKRAGRPGTRPVCPDLFRGARARQCGGRKRLPGPDRIPGHAGAGGRDGTREGGAPGRGHGGRTGGRECREGRVRSQMLRVPPVRHQGRRAAAQRSGAEVRRRPEKLKGFIRNPGKVNPDYPSMPKL